MRKSRCFDFFASLVVKFYQFLYKMKSLYIMHTSVCADTVLYLPGSEWVGASLSFLAASVFKELHHWLLIVSCFLGAVVAVWLEQISPTVRVGDLIPPLFSHMSVSGAKHWTPTASDICPMYECDLKHSLFSTEWSIWICFVERHSRVLSEWWNEETDCGVKCFKYPGRTQICLFSTVHLPY